MRRNLRAVHPLEDTVPVIDLTSLTGSVGASSGSATSPEEYPCYDNSGCGDKSKEDTDDRANP